MTALNEYLRCARRRCRKIPRGKQALRERERYAPYCSFHCQEWARLEDAQAYIDSLKATDGPKVTSPISTSDLSWATSPEGKK